MTPDQAIVFGILLCSLILFAVGRWRYDVVALLVLLVAAVLGVVPAEEAFQGFGHPAVVTVAAVLVASRGLINSGLVDSIARVMSRVGEKPMVQVLSLTGLVAVCSAFMNNVGALALLMPVALGMARGSGLSPSVLLMPLSFGSLLGGMTTLIGTPPNIIIASFRREIGSDPFRMFDFTPAGLTIAVIGVLFIALFGRYLIPQRKGQASREELFRIEDYISEVHVPDGSKMVGKPLHVLEEASEGDATIVGLSREGQNMPLPSKFEILRPGDILVVEADSNALKSLVQEAQLNIGDRKESVAPALGSNEVTLAEAVVMPGSMIEGNTAWTLRLRWRYGVNLLGVARQGVRMKERLRNIQFSAGDVLLLQGETGVIQETLSLLGCLPLAERGLRLGQPRRLALGAGIFGVGLLSTASGLLPVQIGLSAAAVAMIFGGLLSLREAYESINWPVLVLLGAMIPVGQALESTGGASLVAAGLLGLSNHLTPPIILLILLVATMFLSDVMNNAAAAILMAPIGLSIANGLGLSPDPFLMAVAIGASCAFLTPVGHQSNALVMGPGGYQFGDYWRLGLPLEILIMLISVPLLLHFWPIH